MADDTPSQWYGRLPWGALRTGSYANRVLALYALYPSTSAFAYVMSAAEVCRIIDWVGEAGELRVGNLRRTRRRLVDSGRLAQVEAEGHSGRVYRGYRTVIPPAPADLLDQLDQLDPGVRHVSQAEHLQQALEAAVAVIPGPVYVMHRAWAADGPLGSLVAPGDPAQAEWWARLYRLAVCGRGAPLATCYTSDADRLQMALLVAQIEVARMSEPPHSPGGWMWSLVAPPKPRRGKQEPPEWLSTILSQAEVREFRARGARNGWITLADALLRTETDTETAPPLRVVAAR